MIRYIQNKYLSPGRDPGSGRKSAAILLGVAGTAFNIMLFILKATAGSISGSIAITADGFNNLADVGSCLLTLLGILLGNKKPAKKYPFGYGRFEYLSGLLISAAVIVLGIRMMISSVSKIIAPTDISGKPIVIVILTVSIAVKGYMYVYNSRIGKQIDSAGMTAAALDSLSDCAATLAIIISILIERFTGINIDGYAGALVAVCILWAGYISARESLHPLMGMGIDDETISRIMMIASRHKCVTGVYDVAVHDYGPRRKILTVRVTATGNASLAAAQMKDEIMTELGFEAVICTEDKEKLRESIKDGSTDKNNIDRHI